MIRQRRTSRSVTYMGGCFDCHGDEAHWFGKNTMGLAARHHDLTGHTTWVDQHLCVRYGAETPGDRE